MKISLEFNDSSVQAAFNRLLRAGANMTPAMKDIAEHLHNVGVARFDTQTAPDGTPWADNTQEVKDRKTRDSILTELGHLRLLSSAEGPDFVEIGSSRIYASTHQFGAAEGAFGTNARGNPIPWKDIPARPFLGLAPDDPEAIQRIIRQHIQRAWGRE